MQFVSNVLPKLAFFEIFSWNSCFFFLWFFHKMIEFFSPESSFFCEPLTNFAFSSNLLMKFAGFFVNLSNFLAIFCQSFTFFCWRLIKWKFSTTTCWNSWRFSKIFFNVWILWKIGRNTTIKFYDKTFLKDNFNSVILKKVQCLLWFLKCKIITYSEFFLICINK